VAPSRITFGLEQALADFNETRNEGMFKDLGSAELFLSIRGWFRQLDYQWSRLVLGFDNQTQTDLLKKLLGDLTSQKMTLFFLSVLGIVSIFLLVLFFPVRRRSTLPKHQRIYLNAVELVSNFTEIARKNKGSTAYFKQVKPFLPVHAASLFGTLTQDFEHAQYQGATDGGRDGQKQKERTMADTIAALQKDLKRTKAN
jgi:hypothetical protein